MVQATAQLKGVVKLERGAEVEVRGLEKSKELNGLVGRLLEFDPVKLRWGVELDGGRKIALKMQNLLPLSTKVEPAVEVPHLGPVPLQPEEAAAVPTDPALDAAPAQAAAGPKPNSAPPQAADVRVQADSAPDPAPEAAFAAEEPTAELSNEEWPVLPTSEETKAKIRSGCWWDGGSAAARFTEQLLANDASLRSVCLVPPKRFDEEDCRAICDALEANSVATELVASGHALSEVSCQRLARMLKATRTLEAFSVGESSLGDRASILFEGLAANCSVTSIDLEHKGLTASALAALAAALEERRRELGAAPLGSLALSRNVAIGSALAAGVELQAPAELSLCECGLQAAHAASLGRWVARGVQSLNLRDNSSFGGEGVELLLGALGPSAPLQRLRLDGCSAGDDGAEAVAEAIARGLDLEELSVERCELTLAGCQSLATALRGRRLRSLSVRANVIGDEGCALLARCADRLDLSSTSLTGQVLAALGEQNLVSLELFSNPTLGPSVGTWCEALDDDQWQQLEYLDITGCGLGDAGFECVCNTLLQRPRLMPKLRDLLVGANEVTENDEKCDLVDRLGAARGGRLTTKWQNV